MKKSNIIKKIIPISLLLIILVACNKNESKDLNMGLITSSVQFTTKQLNICC